MQPHYTNEALTTDWRLYNHYFRYGGNCINNTKKDKGQVVPALSTTLWIRTAGAEEKLHAFKICGRFTLGERARGTQCAGSWMGHRDGLKARRREKSMPPLGLESQSSNLFRLIQNLGYDASDSDFICFKCWQSRMIYWGDFQPSNQVTKLLSWRHSTWWHV